VRKKEKRGRMGGDEEKRRAGAEYGGGAVGRKGIRARGR